MRELDAGQILDVHATPVAPHQQGLIGREPYGQNIDPRLRFKELKRVDCCSCVTNPLWALPASTANSLSSAGYRQTAVAKYMAKRRRSPPQDWRTFVHNQADAIASIDMFVVPTISFGLLHGLLINTAMGDLLKLIWYAVAGLFRSRAATCAALITSS
jgi:hypothetical protein